MQPVHDAHSLSARRPDLETNYPRLSLHEPIVRSCRCETAEMADTKHVRQFTLAAAKSKFCAAGSAAGDDFYDFQPVARIEPAPGKLGRGHRLAVVLHHHAAWQQLLRDQKFLNRAWQFCLDWLSVGGDKI